MERCHSPNEVSKVVSFPFHQASRVFSGFFEDFRVLRGERPFLDGVDVSSLAHFFNFLERRGCHEDAAFRVFEFFDFVESVDFEMPDERRDGESLDEYAEDHASESERKEEIPERNPFYGPVRKRQALGNQEDHHDGQSSAKRPPREGVLP